MTTCCCHGIDGYCPFGWEDDHVHKCLPHALDLPANFRGGWRHCPDSGCGGNCWELWEATA